MAGDHHPHASRTGWIRWANVRAAGINVCSGGIVGMGEARSDRVGFVHTLATLPRHPESVPVNALVPVKGTVLGDMLADTPLADRRHRIRPHRRGGAHHHAAQHGAPFGGPRIMSEATQALCFLAGANSIFTGDRLLTAPMPATMPTPRCSPGWV
jgi:biotin synthase